MVETVLLWAMMVESLTVSVGDDGGKSGEWEMGSMSTRIHISELLGTNSLVHFC